MKVTVDLGLALAVGVSIVVAITLVWRYASYWKGRFASILPGEDYGSFEDFCAATPQLTDNDKTAEPAIFLTDRITKVYDEANDATKNLETKATTILGFVGGGASLFALATSSGSAPAVSVTPLVVAGLVLFLGALVACLSCLVGRKRRGLPELRREFASAVVLNDPRTTKSRVAAYLFLALLNRFYDYIRINAKKSYSIEVAQQLFAFGVIAIVLNYFVAAAAPRPPAKPVTIHCTASGKTVTLSNKLDCTADPGGKT